MAIEIRKGTMADVEGFITLLAEVRETMEHQEWFYLDPPELIRQRMADGTMELWVAMDGDRLAAGLNLVYPGLEEDNYGYHLGFDREKLMQVIHMDTAAVHPDYRGQGLQRRLLAAAQKQLQGRGERYLLCTIHPENRFSLDNARSQGYVVQKTLAMYGSVRHILCKKIF